MICAEYIWLGGDGPIDIRSKTKVLTEDMLKNNNIPEWNYDGSSTNQANSEKNTEIILRPVKYFRDPIRGSPHILVLCDTWVENVYIKPLNSDSQGDSNNINDFVKNHERVVHPSNTRYASNRIFNGYFFNSSLEQLSDDRLKAKLGNLDEQITQPWFGIEQEYFITHPLSYYYKDFKRKLDWIPAGMVGYKEKNIPVPKQGKYYCGNGAQWAIGRSVSETHLQWCIQAGLTISGVNAEVANSQWEYQIGPCTGIDASDQLIISRYILLRVGEYYGMGISFEPKLNLRLQNNLIRDDDKEKKAEEDEEWNGSGAHVNYSNKWIRKESIGLDYIYKTIEKMDQNHQFDIENYGEDNKLRMTGECETASYEKFTWGIGTRNTSVRIGNNTYKEGCGYFEDRRPSANCDPYTVTSLIHTRAIEAALDMLSNK